MGLESLLIQFMQPGFSQPDLSLALIGKRDSIANKGMYSEEIDANQDIATTGLSTAKKGANQVEKEVQAIVNTKRKISKPAYLKDYV